MPKSSPKWWACSQKTKKNKNKNRDEDSYCHAQQWPSKTSWVIDLTRHNDHCQGQVFGPWPFLGSNGHSSTFIDSYVLFMILYILTDSIFTWLSHNGHLQTLYLRSGLSRLPITFGILASLWLCRINASFRALVPSLAHSLVLKLQDYVITDLKPCLARYNHFCMFLKYRAKSEVFYLKNLDLTLLKGFKILCTICILLIVPMRIYINRNLWQYERSFDLTSTASRLILPHITIFALPSSTPSQLHATTPQGAPPLSWWMWARLKMPPESTETQIPATSAPPLSRGMWAAQWRSTGGMNMRGPLSTSQKRTMTKVVVRFHHSSLSSLPLTTYAQRRCFTQH